jgi:hypothetical protein
VSLDCFFRCLALRPACCFSKTVGLLVRMLLLHLDKPDNDPINKLKDTVSSMTEFV